jgi:MYXO-CTERM domain-containing protein
MQASTKLFASIVALLLCAAFAPRAHATAITYSIFGTGIAEVNAAGVPNQGDLDGTSVGTLLLDNGTGSGTTGFATLQITLNNVDLTTLSGHHVHQAPATTTGSIVLDFGDPDTIRVGNVLSGTITGLPAATITNVFATPTNFYYNVHNGAFPAGAVRSQLPEPGAAGVIGLAALAALRRRRTSN